MYFSDYYKNSVSYDEAQFAIAIALDQLNDLMAAKAVLNFLSPAKAGINNRQEVLQQRKELREKVSNSPSGVVYATLEYYYKQPVFQVVKRSRVANTKQMCPLSQLTRSSLDMVYNKTMQLLIENPTKKLIAVYTKTQMFTKEFIAFIRNSSTTSGKRSGSGTVSESTALELANKFSQFVYENCADGAYHADSCTPNSFLFAKKSTGNGDTSQMRPIDWFQRQNDGEYFDILNRKGTNTDVGEDLTLLDSVEVDLSKNEFNIPFTITCEKISRASALLFTHNNTIYFDILSYHKKAASAELKKNIEKLKLLGVNFSYGYDINAICDGKDNLRNKFRSRCNVCDVFEEVLTHGMRKEDTKNLYQELLQLSINTCANASGTKDAKSIFSFGDYSSREPGNNGSKMITLLEGYAALKDLIDFLNSDSNTRGISVEEFPCDIFRYPSLLKRFKSFEQYIDYGDEVKSLYREVTSSSERRKEYLDGVYNNDYVYDVLKNSQLIKQDVTLQTIARTPFNALQNAVDLFETTGKDNDFRNNIITVSSYWQKSLECFTTAVNRYGVKRPIDLFNVVKMRELEPHRLQLLSNMLAGWVLNSVVVGLDVARDQLLNYLIICAFATCVRAASMQPSNLPVSDIYGHYLLEGKGIIDTVYFPDSLTDVKPEIQNQILINRAKAIKAAMFFLWETEDDRASLGQFDTDWKDVRNFWYVTTKMSRFILQNEDVLQIIYSDKEDLALMKIETVTYLRFLRLVTEQVTPKSISDFAILRNPVDPEYTLPYVSRQESYVLADSLNDRFCKSFKYFFECLSDVREVYANLIVRSDTTFNKLNNFINVNSLQENLLAKAADSVVMRVLSGNARPKEEQILSILTEFDELGYAMSGTSRFNVDGRYFIHKKGYVVNLNQVTGIHSVEELTDDMIARLRQSLL